MANAEHITWLTQQLAITVEAMGQSMSSNAMAIMAVDLSTYPPQQVATALQRVRLENKGRFSLALVLEQLDKLAGRPGPEEAWAIALQAKDEAKTVIWTDEIAQAWAIAAPMATGRDTVAARMAFKEAYARITQEARDTKRRPVVEVSVGHDKAMRLEVLVKAVELGQIPMETALHHLEGDAELINGRLVALASTTGPAIAYTPDGIPYKLPRPDTGIQMLLANAKPSSATPPPDVLAKLQAQLAAIRKKTARRKLAQARLQRLQEKRRKQDMEGAVRRYLERNPQAASQILKQTEK